ncbi:MAG TPA: hypothetical protein IGS53_17755 [Leptolyngbyaceae cyanobacterium M33_DOE_097]|uniref:Uncharacterized protein n=1 Tax=Oscillatoriales cyanobacterium SpSt-418 TaxID=2282169 RepID=A0A7C3KHA1_9CYAN|nr:hypothetical protein [Leptolyngbyaceae cyanobacterium M33_DOE_097]
MNTSKDPKFLVDHQSVASLINQLHEYFKDSHAHYEVERSQLMSKLDTVDQERELELHRELRKVEAEISLFSVLSDALSIADRILHTRSVMNELGLDNPLYRMHCEAIPDGDNKVSIHCETLPMDSAEVTSRN